MIMFVKRPKAGIGWKCDESPQGVQGSFVRGLARFPICSLMAYCLFGCSAILGPAGISLLSVCWIFFGTNRCSNNSSVR